MELPADFLSLGKGVCQIISIVVIIDNDITHYFDNYFGF